MLQGKYTRKMVAATLLTILMTNTFAPTAALALTSGPTQPEATSFEPVDTTDMVNLQTGDLTYNVPLIEIPGPEGSFPLSLSYHAGIQPNEDASWVGLGWTLNPGAISRNVNGYPDDWYNPTTSNHVYWSGGDTKTYSVGVNIGLANSATVGAGLSFSQDTYRGFGVGANESIGYAFKTGGGTKLNASIGVGVSPYGDEYAFGGVSEQYGLGKGNSSKGYNASVGVQFSTNFKSLEASFSGGIGFKNHSLLGASISTSGHVTESTGGLLSSINNSNAGHVSVSTHGFSVDIPVYAALSVSLGYSKQRYWTDETAGMATHGSLNSSGWQITNSQAYDEYALLEDPKDKSIVDYPDPTTVQGGAFPDFDVYMVNAQGLGGNMRPYLFQGGILNQNILNGSTPLTTYYTPGVVNSAPFFRFENDFSNSYRQSYQTYSDPSLNLRAVTPPFDNAPVYGNSDGTTGFGGGSAVAGSKQVKVGLTVHPIPVPGYVAGDRLQNGMIEGYSITNESGMTYHFGLPAYSYGEENYQEKIDQSTGLAFNRDSKSNPYAYTWYLTTITGPDFVDRNNDGMANDGDWGYWVNFEYGKWSNKYTWRNPSEGFRRDEDNKWQNCSIGNKEVYYLNAIRTRSHVALFEKDLRMDGKGESSAAFNTNSTNSKATNYNNQGIFDVNSAQSLSLTKIYLLNASDENFVSPSSGNSSAYKPQRTLACSDCELPADVLDKTDVDAVGRANLESKAIRVIDFNYDYSLCPNTSNSFESYPVNSAIKSGKLTLTSLVTRGKGGANSFPPILFNYGLAAADMTTQTGVSLSVNSSAGSFTTTNANFKVGDMVMQNNSPLSDVYCGVITNVTSSGSSYTYTLANGDFTGTTTAANVYTTKNPPYRKDAYDVWGMYKSDYNLIQITSNENLGRTTSIASSKSVDAWSLRTVTTSLGSQIKMGYESDSYSKSVLSGSYSFVATSVQQVSGNANQLRIDVADIANGISLNNYFTLNGRIDFLMSLRSVDPNSVLASAYPCSWANLVFTNEIYDTKNSGNTTYVRQIGDTYVIVENADFSGFYQSPVPVVFQSGAHITTTCIGNRIPNACNIRVFGQPILPGGGIRTKEIDLIDPLRSSINSTIYSYNSVNNPGYSSGVTSYEPWVFENYQILNPNSNDAAGVKLYQNAIYKNMNSILAISREIPSPGVMYQYVTVTNQFKNADESSSRTMVGSTQYEFEVFRENMVGRMDATTRTGPITSASWGVMFSRNLVLDKFIASIGNVKRVSQFDSDGRELTETVTHYLHDGLENLPLAQFITQYKSRLSQYNYQGYLQERYSEVKEVQNQTNSADNGVKATFSAREEYPSIITGQTMVNHVNGTQTNSNNLVYDFYSGALTKSLETDAYGNSFMTENTPAYTLPQYASMGLKINTDANKNMLTQTAETKIWKVDAANNNNKIGLISASVNTWSNQIPAMGTDGASNSQINIWRPQYSYNWLPTTQTSDGITPYASFSEFNWATPSSSDIRWSKTLEVTLYDVYSKILEGKDIDNNYAGTHMDFGENKIILTGSPANYYELAYSGAEDAAVSQTANVFVKAGDGTIAAGAGVAHTGAQSLLLGVSGKKGFLYTVNKSQLTAGRAYTASVWVKPVTGSVSTVKLYYDIDGTIKPASISSGSSTKKAGAWSLINLAIPAADIASGSVLHVWTENDDPSVQAYVDDMRFQPLNASTAAYVYDPFSGELTHILDNSNLYTRFEYDAVGRLVHTYKEKLGIGEFKTNEYLYNYGATKFSSAPINQGYTKNNCTATQTPSVTQITLPSGAYVSYISQQDADQRAQIYAQDQANMQGICTQLIPISFTKNYVASGTTTVAFKQSGVTKYTYTFPTANNTPASHNILPGTYTMTFTTSASPTTTYYYSLLPGTSSWYGATVTTAAIAFSLGTNYTISVSDLAP